MVGSLCPPEPSPQDLGLLFHISYFFCIVFSFFSFSEISSFSAISFLISGTLLLLVFNKLLFSGCLNSRETVIWYQLLFYHTFAWLLLISFYHSCCLSNDSYITSWSWLVHLSVSVFSNGIHKIFMVNMKVLTNTVVCVAEKCSNMQI